MIKVDKETLEVNGSGISLIAEWALITTHILGIGLSEKKLPGVKEVMEKAFEYATSDEAVELMRLHTRKEDASTM